MSETTPSNVEILCPVCNKPLQVNIGMHALIGSTFECEEHGVILKVNA